MWPEPRPTSVPSGLLIHPARSDETSKLPRNGRETRYLVQAIAKTAIDDVRLTPTPKPAVEIWRKLHKRTVPLSLGELGPHLTLGHVVLHEDPAHPPKRGTAP